MNQLLNQRLSQHRFNDTRRSCEAACCIIMPCTYTETDRQTRRQTRRQTNTETDTQTERQFSGHSHLPQWTGHVEQVPDPSPVATLPTNTRPRFLPLRSCPRASPLVSCSLSPASVAPTMVMNAAATMPSPRSPHPPPIMLITKGQPDHSTMPPRRATAVIAGIGNSSIRKVPELTESRLTSACLATSRSPGVPVKSGARNSRPGRAGPGRVSGWVRNNIHDTLLYVVGRFSGLVTRSVLVEERKKGSYRNGPEAANAIPTQQLIISARPTPWLLRSGIRSTEEDSISLCAEHDPEKKRKKEEKKERKRHSAFYFGQNHWRTLLVFVVTLSILP